MGQYYKLVILSETGIIRVWAEPRNIKLMEHSYQDTPFMNGVEYILSVQGMFYKSRIVWAGDYADKEMENLDENLSENLYSLAHYENPIHKNKMIIMTNTVTLQYIVNHNKKLYVDKTKQKDIHPLPLLVSEGNGNGGGDYYGNNEELCGTWARDIISMESTIPDGYTELVCQFTES
jgi:hypothetical protein